VRSPLPYLLTRALALGLVALPLAAGHPVSRDAQDPLVQAAHGYLHGRRADLGMDHRTTFVYRKGRTDEVGETHARFHQHYQGVRVWQGDAITHTDAKGAHKAPTLAVFSHIDINTNPSIQASEALATAHGDLMPKGPYANDPTAELVVLPHTYRALKAGAKAASLEHAKASEIEDRVLEYQLAWHVHTELENGPEETKHVDYLISAHSGAILKSWNTLHTAKPGGGGTTTTKPAVGTGTSQWYGPVTLNTVGVYASGATTPSSYQLTDTTRPASGGNSTYDLAGRTSGTGTIYSDANNAWGNGIWYGSGSYTTTSETGQTAAVDAHRGLQATWDFYKTVFGRNGINNAGKAAYSRVHYSRNYDNAFWSDSCFCMTYGDGNSTGSHGEADLDTVGHEVSHGVCATEANLTYSGESGGLNEASSDILGTMVEFWVLGGASGSTIPNAAGSATTNGGKYANYKLFENSWAHSYPNDALRWMHKPSRDGASPDAWSSTLGSLDVHYSSGVANHFFFLLAHGPSIDTLTGPEASPVVAGTTAPTPIGNDKAARIWYKALCDHMTSSTNYAGARKATLDAAALLYGSGSPEYNAVAAAWTCVGVN